VISNWQDSAFDLRPRGLAVAEPGAEVVISGEVAAVLRALSLLGPHCERLGFRIRAYGAAAILIYHPAAAVRRPR
jgi:hypothetical protein